MIRRLLRKPDAHKLPQRQRIGKTPRDPTLAVDALKVPNRKRPEENPRRQARPPLTRRIELPAKSLNKPVELLPVQKLVQPLLEPVINFAPVSPMESAQLLQSDCDSEGNRNCIPCHISQKVRFTLVLSIRATCAAPQS
jgi:hypothetical protein